MSKFLAQSPQDKLQAIEAHALNLRAASKYWPWLSLIEIGLRTALSTQLDKKQSAMGRDVHWTVDPNHLVRNRNSRSAKDLENAKTNLRRRHKPVKPGYVMDELPLGFWTLLVSKRFKDLWPDLADGFRGLDSRNPRELAELLTFFKTFRNRIGHHHVIVFGDLEDADMKLLRLAHLIDPRLENYILSLKGDL